MNFNTKNLMILSLLAMLTIGSCCGQNEQGLDILAASRSVGNLDTFARAIQDADLVDRLNDEGGINLQNDSYIVFAPSDRAFANLTTGALDRLLANQDDLKDVMNYHIVENPDVADFRNLISVDRLSTLEGGDLNISSTNGVMMVNDARILSYVQYKEGIIYVIDRVLLTQDHLSEYGANLSTGTVGVAGTDANADMTNDDGSTAVGTTARTNVSASNLGVLDALRQDGDLGTFANAIESAEFADELDGAGTLDTQVVGGFAGGPYTIFAPTNEAFNRIPSTNLTALIADNGDLGDLLKHHIADRSGWTENQTLNGISSLDTLYGGPLDINANDGTIVVDGTTVLRTIDYANGEIYVINRVLLPNDQDFLNRYSLSDALWNDGVTTRMDSDNGESLPLQAT